METFQQFEREWAKFNDLDPAGMVACSSGTAALHLALETLQLPQGSEIVIPDLTMVACARAATLSGLMPVFVDCDGCLLVTPYLVNKAIEASILTDPTPLVRSIMAVHVYGRRQNMEGLARKAEDWDCVVVEDLAEAHGLKPYEETDVACWSHYRNKAIFGAEGGTVWFKDEKRAALARQLRSLGFTAKHDYNHIPRGHNYRMSNIHAELILTSLRLAPAYLYMRRIIEGYYDKYCPVEWKMPPRDAVWVYDVRVSGMTRQRQTQVVEALLLAGIQARRCFAPMHSQEEYKNCRMIRGTAYPRQKLCPKCFGSSPTRAYVECGTCTGCGTESTYTLRDAGWPDPDSSSTLASREVIYLPVEPGMTTEEDCKRAFEIIEKNL